MIFEYSFLTNSGLNCRFIDRKQTELPYPLGAHLDDHQHLYVLSEAGITLFMILQEEIIKTECSLSNSKDSTFRSVMGYDGPNLLFITKEGAFGVLSKALKLKLRVKLSDSAPNLLVQLAGDRFAVAFGNMMVQIVSLNKYKSK